MSENENEVGLQETDIIYAMPTLAMLPANNFKISISEEMHSFELPCAGTYYDLDPTFFTEEDGSFTIFADNIFYVSNITKVLFGVKKYPALADNQLFCPISFKIIGDAVAITGKVVTMLED